MGISRREAFETLELPFGADQDSIRTSYKRLSMKWHPDKHKNSPESIKNFLEISMGYKRLNIESDIVQMSVSDCLDLYKNTFNPSKPAYSNGYHDSDEDDSEDYEDDDDDEDDLDDLDYFLHKKCTIGHIIKDARGSKTLSPEEIEKNANELITEEEKEKRKAEKRRAKKKRRREKKRQEKVADQHKEAEQKSNKDLRAEKSKVKKQEKKSTTSRPKKKTGSSGSEDEFDQSAAFFTQVVKKKKSTNVTDQGSNKPKMDLCRTTNGIEESVEDLDPVVLRSRQLAIEGNKMANFGHYQAAIDLFTEAVKLDPRDFRFFGNRSYCFDRMQQYEKALKDSERAINLAPDWPKGYFRKGRALAGLKLYAEAEQAFMQVLKLDRNCEDAIQELLRVRTHQLTEMGFSSQQAQTAIRQYESVPQALESLLAGMVAENSLATEVYMSDDEDYGGTPQAVSLHTPPPTTLNIATQPSKAKQGKMNPCNPEGLTALWVGNVLPEVTEKRLQHMFSKFGQVTSVRLLPEKYCAFINFKTKEAAGAAMKGLQKAPCAGQQLLIKFPDNPIANGANLTTGAVRKTVPTSAVKPKSTKGGRKA